MMFLQACLPTLNGDGTPDAYWGRLSFISRMDDNGNVNNPAMGPVRIAGVQCGTGQQGRLTGTNWMAGC